MPAAEAGQGWTDWTGEQAAEISNWVVKLVTEHTGRGPTRARTYFNEDLVTVLLQDSLTRGENSLVREGRHELVLEIRLAFQQNMRPELVAGIERVTGRRVRAFLSANHIEPDVAIESFVLDGAAEDRAERVGRSA
jgi:uncharacterized protein YbcI